MIQGIPRSYRMMQGFGVNTFTLVNAEGKRVFVKFIMTPELGVHSLMWDEALKIAGQDPGMRIFSTYLNCLILFAQISIERIFKRPLKMVAILSGPSEFK